MTTIHDVAGFIGSATEAECNLIFDWTKKRTRAVRALNADIASATIKAGDRVRLKNISPKYLSGAQGIVEERSGSNFVVMLDDQVGRFGGYPITVKPQCVEAV